MTEGQQRLDLGNGLYIMFVEIAGLKEQDVNAQVMSPRHFAQLAENIRDQGQIESLPYAHQPNGEGPIAIISGHHRARAAREAGLKSIPVIVDTKEMTRSEITAKQIAHNELNGKPDEDILRQMISFIDNADDMLKTGLDESMMPVVEKDDTALLLPHADFDWRVVTLMFLPDQVESYKAALDLIDKNSETVGVAALEQFEPFARAMLEYGRLNSVKSVVSVITHLTYLAKARIQIAGLEVEDADEWIPVEALLGTTRIPAAVAGVVKQAIDRMVADETINPKHPWQALEALSADYLAGA